MAYFGKCLLFGEVDSKDVEGMRRLVRLRCEQSSLFLQEVFHGQGAGMALGWQDYPVDVWNTISRHLGDVTGRKTHL